MGNIDATTWQAVGITLTVLGLVLTMLVWRRRGATAGLRGVAWSLLPAAAGLTGTLRLLWRIGNEIVDWAVRLVLSPLVWGGIVLAGISLCLFVLTAALRARGAGSRPRDRRQRLTAERSAPAARPVPPEKKPQDDDMDDIEAILRRHGIS